MPTFTPVTNEDFIARQPSQPMRVFINNNQEQTMEEDDSIEESINQS